MFLVGVSHIVPRVFLIVADGGGYLLLVPYSVSSVRRIPPIFVLPIHTSNACLSSLSRLLSGPMSFRISPMIFFPPR